MAEVSPLDTPGETPGAICLQDKLHNILFTGDTFLIGGSLLAHLEESNFDVYFDSLKYLSGLLDQVDHLCPAHNEAYVPKESLHLALDAFEQIASGLIEPEFVENKFIYHFKEFNVITPYMKKNK